MTPTEPIPTGPAFSARLHDALAVLGEPVTTPEQRHGGWLLSLERAADQIRTGITGRHAWAIARDVVQRAATDPRQSPEDRATIQETANVLTDAVTILEADGTPTLQYEHIDLAYNALVCALEDAQTQGKPVAGRSTLELLLAVGHAAITLLHVMDSVPELEAPDPTGVTA